uniref:ATP synthase F0 subunit 8 n=2 Tax=Berytidae TaxID=236388 RepID=B7SMP7_9HEMI|nr:ATP synthase F0 subunit 8 [Yemmalysus parallelus]ABZ02141.1 ATP synthase F0 subunit 8 [Yemmalysus parallelus]UPL65497.1 ATPase subunit 8 [Metatropis brevirostris]
MPQMAPLWWETLFIMFLLLYLIMNIMIFWTKGNKLINKKSLTKSFKELNWKF